jgi:hypothetical protein
VDKGAGVYLSQVARRPNSIGARTGAAESLFRYCTQWCICAPADLCVVQGAMVGVGLGEVRQVRRTVWGCLSSGAAAAISHSAEESEE